MGLARARAAHTRLAAWTTVVLVLGAVGWTASASGATWSLQAAANVVEAEHDYLYEAACEPGSLNVCMAVGSKVISGADSPLTETWNGEAWVVQPVATPREASGSELDGDSCAARTSCLAVGFYGQGTSELTLAEVWSGREWSVQSTPNPTGATHSRLNAVSCSGTSACTAVGYSDGTSRTAIAERWNGTTWSLQTVPGPSGALSAEFEGVACASASFCIAAGRYTESLGTIRALSATWNGSTWSLQAVPSPSGSSRDVLLDVSCSEAEACTGVGGYSESSGVQATLVERWNGTRWSVQATPNPARSAASVLQNVACSSSSSCMAVGDWINGARTVTLAESWNGVEWTVETTLNPATSSFVVLWGVACTTEACRAVGWDTNAEARNVTLAEKALI